MATALACSRQLCHRAEACVQAWRAAHVRPAHAPVVSTSSTPGLRTLMTTSLLLPRSTAACTCGASTTRNAQGCGPDSR